MAGFFHHPVIEVSEVNGVKLVKLPGQQSRMFYFQCPHCKNLFPERYRVKNKRSPKEYGTKQLMCLWAWHNFEKHLESCKKKGGIK